MRAMGLAPFGVGSEPSMGLTECPRPDDLKEEMKARPGRSGIPFIFFFAL